MKVWSLVACGLLWGCGAKETGPEPAQCRAFAAGDFDRDSGWDSAGYCDAATDLGCYPWHESSADTCGPFTTMRTSATPGPSAEACRVLLSSLNCGTYRSEDGDSELGFHILEADRFTMRATGSYRGRAVDTTFFFNPCHQACQAAVTLVALDDNQQTICDIPRQGKPVCLFPETAHSLTFVRADGGSVVLRTAGNETALARVVDAE